MNCGFQGEGGGGGHKISGGPLFTVLCSGEAALLHKFKYRHGNWQIQEMSLS